MHISFLSVATALLSVASAQDLASVLSGSEDLTQLNSLIKQFPDLAQTLTGADNITILAPNNEAIAALLASPEAAKIAQNPDAIRAILTYHVVPGTYEASAIPEQLTFVPTLLTNASYTNVTGGQVVGVVRSGEEVTITSGGGEKSKVAQADVKFDGGVVHIIDKVLTLPASISATATAAGLTALTDALGKTKLVEAVDGLKDVTVFAPNNEAFEKIASTLSEASVEDITTILTYHVINGTVGYSTALTNDQKIATFQGGEVAIKIDGSNVFVNDAQVVIADVLVANGVVHVINAVLNPENSDATPTSTATTSQPTGGFTNTTIPTPKPPTVSDNAAPGLSAAVGSVALFGGIAALFGL